MSYDPSLPHDHAEIVAAELRGQFTGLKALIDAAPAGPPGPQGPAGADGATGADGRSIVNVYDDGMGRAIVQMSDNTTYGPFTIASGPEGQQGPQGNPGEVSYGDLNNAINSTAQNPSSISTLDMPMNDPDMETLRQKLNELISALRR